jgi:hypothetical protein
VCVCVCVCMYEVGLEGVCEYMDVFVRMCMFVSL